MKQSSRESKTEHDLKGLQNQLAKAKSDLKTISKNMTLADTKEQLTAMKPIFNDLKATEKNLETEIVTRSQIALRESPKLSWNVS